MELAPMVAIKDIVSIVITGISTFRDAFASPFGLFCGRSTAFSALTFAGITSFFVILVVVDDTGSRFF